MLADQRRELILAEVERTGAIRISELTELLGVSDMTVRRDLEHLEARGWLRKVHGGAVLSQSSVEESSFEAKSALQQPAKRAIAARALQLVEPHTAIGLSAGTTTWMLARGLQGTEMPLSVVTNSTTVADILAVNAGPHLRVVLTGGERTPSAALVGAIADRAIGSLHVDRLFLGVHGMDARVGFSCPNLAEAQTNQALIDSARQIVVLADSTKWGVVGLANFGKLGAADILITDDGISAEARRVLEDQVGKLIVVPVSEGTLGKAFAGTTTRQREREHA
ncbi:DeoR/GlpR family DNA-binding transcription regulator [Nakamurella deserti]|uniref:DeoR/GlpR family DNA-binding transcription regulator n=1 Tax=Nakamurella deserti TaxID=2164074 RepID=UPI000DBE8692|nr:DeoR/GlpR family DNA-binding transcription regulator [Nakamurella deserti]